MFEAGPNFPQTASQEGYGATWYNVDNIKIEDNYAHCIVPYLSSSNLLRGSNFGFDIPLDVVVTSVKVEIRRVAELSYILAESPIYLVNDGGVNGSNKGEEWVPVEEETLTLQGDSSYWGFTLTPTVVNSANFGLRYGVAHADPVEFVSCGVYVRWFKITVYYSVPLSFKDVRVRSSLWGVTTQAATDIKPNQLTVHGTYISPDGVNCKARGFEWGTVDGGPYPHSWVEEGDFAPGSYSYTITGLNPGQTIYFRAKAAR